MPDHLMEERGKDLEFMLALSQILSCSCGEKSGGEGKV